MKYITGLLFLLLSYSLANAQPECVLFFYHHKSLPDDIYYTYDWIVLDQDNPYFENVKNKFYMKNKAKVIAYISIGEIEQHRSYFNQLKKFSIGSNPMWASFIADLREKEYRDFIINKISKELVNKGFDGFFLDTLDSYQLVTKQDSWIEFQKAEIELIKELKKNYPDKIIILNRGFEIIDEVKNFIDGVVVESLFYGIDSQKRYREVTEKERNYLVAQLEKIKSFGIPVIVIDYIDPKDKEKAKDTVKKISSLGFIPYVSNAELSRVGFSRCEIVPRKIILLFDSSITPVRQITDIHRLIQMPLEYLGFIPELYDINEKLPEVYPELGYKAVVSMDIKNKSEKLDNWLINAKKEGLKLFFINDFPFKNLSALKEFGITFEKNRSKSFEFKIVQKISADGFEAPLVVTYTDTMVYIEKAIEAVKAKNSDGQIHLPFAITDWGGYAVGGTLINSEELWVYNPFKVFEKVFKDKDFPVPDPTTENGRRVLTVHIDGDGFLGNTEFEPSKTTGEIIRDEILKKFPIPHTISIIEGEVAQWGLYPQKSKKLEEVAKSIFKLPYVEPATHSFSHPFVWQIKYDKKENLPYGHNLPIPNYRFNLEREICGSIDYINSLLKEEDKKVKVFLWTGDCSPNEDQIKFTYQLKVFNLNGGHTNITKQEPFLNRVSPMGVNYGTYFQIYAPVTNENMYTNLWRGPFWGYIQVIQTFELTEKPIRLKPLSIYYHFYSASKLNSLNALKEVYKYALSQPTNPMFLSEYVEKVLDFRQTAILSLPDGFKIKNAGYLRTLRIPKALGYPDVEKSKGVVGFMINGNEVYIHLDGSGEYILKLTKTKPESFYLITSNGQVESFKKEKGSYFIKLKSYVPLDVQFYKGKCKIFLEKEEKNAEIKAVCVD